MPKITGTLTDFGFSPMPGANPRLYFQHNTPGVAGAAVMSTKRVEVIPAKNGLWEAELTASARIAPAGYYTITLEWSEPPSRKRISERFPARLYVPAEGGILADILRIPANPALVWTGTEPPANPTPGTWWLGDDGLLQERNDKNGWTFKQNLRGPAGYNATGAAEDDKAIAQFIAAGSGPTATAAALDKAYSRRGDVVKRVTDHGVAAGAPAAANTAALNAIFAALPGTFGGAKQIIYLPGGDYEHTGVLIENRHNFEITGPGRLVATNTVYEHVKVKNCRNFKLLGMDSSHKNAVLRRTTPARAFSLESCTDFEVRGSHAHDNEGVGIMLNHCSYGMVAGNKVTHTLADGIGLYGDTHHVTVSGNVTHNTGDDGIAQVGVTPQGVRPHHNTIFGNTIEKSDARGIVVVGGYSTTVVGNTVNYTRAGGIYVSREGTRDTYGCADVIVAHNTIDGANTYEPTITQAGIFVYGDSPEFPVDSVTVTGNIVRNSRSIGIQVGGSRAGTSRVSVSGNRVIGTGLNGMTIFSVTDVTVTDNEFHNLGGYGIFAGAGVAGVLQIKGNLVRRPNVGGSTFAAIGTKEAITTDLTVIAQNTVLDAATAVHGITATGEAQIYGNQLGTLTFEGGSGGQFDLVGNLNITARAARAKTGGGKGVIAMRDAHTVPSENPSNGGVIYIEAGALKYRGSAGTVTVLAPA